MKHILILLGLSLFLALDGGPPPAAHAAPVLNVGAVDYTPAAMTFSNAKTIAYKHRSGMSAKILDSNAASGGRLPVGTLLGELEGSGMTEPSAGLSAWEGTIEEDDDGNRTYSGTWRALSASEIDDIVAGTAAFSD